ALYFVSRLIELLPWLTSCGQSRHTQHAPHLDCERAGQAGNQTPQEGRSTRVRSRPCGTLLFDRNRCAEMRRYSSPIDPSLAFCRSWLVFQVSCCDPTLLPVNGIVVEAITKSIASLRQPNSGQR